MESNRPFNLVLWLAQGFGVGRIPVAPGTVGSVLGVGWCALLLWPGSVEWFVAGTLLGVAAAVGLCGAAERILKSKDPSSVVLDEIAALPVSFAGWFIVHFSRFGTLPGPADLSSTRHGWLTVLVFVLFRVFDITKPWPVRQSQRLPGGWGVTIDDVLAGLYTAMVTGVIAARWG